MKRPMPGSYRKIFPNWVYPIATGFWSESWPFETGMFLRIRPLGPLRMSTAGPSRMRWRDAIFSPTISICGI